MKIIKTSYSALNTFESCPLKYKYQKIDKIRAPKSKEAVFGNKIHKALEYLHSSSPLFPTLSELLDYFKEIWPVSDDEDWPFMSEEEDMVYFSEAIKILKNYYSKISKLKERPVVLDTETSFRIEIEKPKGFKSSFDQCFVNGFIDRIDKTKDGLEIVDYKTSKRFPPQEVVDNNLQLSLYCLGVLDKWPQFAEKGVENIKLTFYYLKHQESISTKRSLDDLKKVKEEVWEVLEEIDKSDFEPKPSGLCDWCPYKQICPMWKHLYKKQLSVDDQKIKEVADEYFKLKEENKKNNKRVNELKEIVDRYLDKEKLDRVFGEIGYITRSSSVRYSYNTKEVEEILKKLGKWEEVLSVDDKKVKEIIESLPSSVRRDIESKKKKDREYFTYKVNKKKKE
ncbi:MAG: DUF2800 domain-containing protein [Candidatus Portnoybacteria bacterium]|nr:DUF2800 domain-containing protein [Candidatus Portnoybacteria bacterium]